MPQSINQGIIMPNNENKVIEKSLALLLKQLKEAKRKEAGWGQNAASGDLDVLNDGIRALENIQFVSVDDIASVRELAEVKQFFSETYLLNDFSFPDFREYIDPETFKYTEIEVQLDTLEIKAMDLEKRGHKLATAEVKCLVSKLRSLNQWYFIDKKINGDLYKTTALKFINESRPLLEQHRGYKQILGNLILFILTAGSVFLLNKVCTGHFLFFKETDSANKINALTDKINTYPSQQSI